MLPIMFSAAARVLAINLLMQFGFQACYFVGVIGCAAYVLGAGAFEVSALVFVINLFCVLGNFVGGVLVDRIGAQKTLLATLAALSATGFAGWFAPLGYALLYVVAASMGLLFGIGTTTIDAYPRFLASAEAELARMNSFANLAVSAAVIGGSLGAGLIASAGGTQTVFAVMALAPLASIVVTLATPETVVPVAAGQKGREQAGGLFAGMVEGFRIIFAHVKLRLIFTMIFLGFFAYGAFDSLESLYYRDVLHASADWMGWLSAMSGAGALVGSLVVVKLPHRYFSLRLLAAMLLATGVGSMIYVGTTLIPVAMLGQFITGLAFQSMGPIRVTLTQRSCDQAYIGRVSGAMRMGMNSAGVVPLLAAPFIANAAGVQATLFGASAFVAAVGLAFYLKLRGERS